MKMENSMAYWYHLRALAMGGDWDGMMESLAENRELRLGYHDTLAQAMFRAASAGRVDVMSEMVAQGFVQDMEDTCDALDALSRNHLPTALPAIAYIVNGRRASPERMLNSLSYNGNTQALTQLKDAGIDIFASSSVFFLAFFGAHEKTMASLYDEGAALFHPTNIKGLYGRKDEPGEAGLAAFAKLVEADAVAAKTALAALTKQPETLAECRETCRDEENRRTTVMHLQARAGEFAQAARVSRAEQETQSPNPLLAQDLLKKDAQGQTVLSILAARHELPLVLDPTLWTRRPEEAAKIIDGLRDMDAAEAVNVEKLMTGLQTPPPSRRRNVFAP